MQKNSGQSLAEYVIVISLIAIVLTTVGPGFRRSVQQVIKSVADVIGFQSDSEQAANVDEGFLNMQRSNVQTFVNGASYKTGGTLVSTEIQQSNMYSESYTNGAFIRD